MTNQEAIDLLDNLIGMIEDNHGSNYDSAIRMAIDALESKWISCDERLPEEGTEVLGTDRDGCIRHVVKDETSLYEFATYEEMMHIDIVAWMPLPEPWMGDEE